MLDRRRFVAGLTTAFLFPQRTFAQQKTLRIIQWSHTVPAYDRWFDAFAAEWGAQRGTRVVVDHIAIGEIAARAAAEVAAGSGHDLVLFVSPPAAYEPSSHARFETYALAIV